MGDLVIAERRRHDGGEKEVTAKLYFKKGRTIELRPESNDKRWQEKFVIDLQKAKDGEEILIIAVVSAVYKSLRRRR